MKRALLALAVLALVVAFGLTLSRRNKQPSYQGRSLDNWLQSYGSRPIGGGLAHVQFSTERRVSSRPLPTEAIRAMGTNAIGPLLNEIQRPDEFPLMVTVKRVINKQKWLKIRLQDVQSRREQAAVAFFDLGSSGVTAIPELTRLLTNYSTSTLAAHALVGIGPNAIPAFTSALADSNSWIRDCGVWGLAQFGTESRDAVPQILQALPKGNNADQMITIWALGEIREPVAVVRAGLASQLKNSDSDVRKSAAQALQKLGPDAKQAGDEIKTALDNETDVEARAALEELIKTLNQDADAPSQPAW